MSLVAPREGEGRRTEWRSGAKRELHGGRDKIWQRAEAENSLISRLDSRMTALAWFSCHSLTVMYGRSGVRRRDKQEYATSRSVSSVGDGRNG